MSVFRRAAVFLGLVDDDADMVDTYDEGYLGDDGLDDDAGAGYDDTEPARRSRAGAERGERRERARDSGARDARPEGGVTVMRAPRPEGTASPVVPRPAGTAGPSVRAVPAVATAASRVHILEPISFNDAQEVGDRLKSGQPVILNLQGADRELARRLIDFASGLCYATNGTMSKVADQVFLLTPPNVEVPEDEVQRLSARGLYHVR
jgi:cell division inhibitor SepF